MAEGQKGVAERIKLTADRVAALAPPETGERVVADATTPGLAVRLRASGAATWVVRYRTGGRGSTERRVTLGSIDAVPLGEARKAAKTILGGRAQGQDPQAERRERARRSASQLGAAVEAYVSDMKRRGVVSAAIIASLLRRELVASLGQSTDLATIGRAHLAKRIEAIAASGRVGLSREFRARVSVFLGWCAERGLVPFNPLAGAKLGRRTKAEEQAVHGRALTAAEIASFWAAATADPDPFFSTLLRVLLLTGCRRGEMAAARWSWIGERDGHAALLLPAAVTKNGHAHPVPLPPMLQNLLAALPRLEGCDLIFPGRGGKVPISGFSKRWPAVRATMADVEGRVMIHDLRRTARSWWSTLGVQFEVAEAMLNHRPRNQLVVIYDRADRWPERFTAAEAWAAKVDSLIADVTAPAAIPTPPSVGFRRKRHPTGQAKPRTLLRHPALTAQ